MSMHEINKQMHKELQDYFADEILTLFSEIISNSKQI